MLVLEPKLAYNKGVIRGLGDFPRLDIDPRACRSPRQGGRRQQVVDAPAHTPLDGDTVFAAATGVRPLADPLYGLAELGTAAANVLARAVARGVYEATALAFAGAQPAWRDRFGR